MTERMEAKIQIVGDDIFVTNPKIFQKGIERGIANSILIKLNQIGTVTETLDAIELAKQAVAEGNTPLIAAGGDGTLSEVVNGLLQATPPDRLPAGPMEIRGDGGERG